MTDRRYWFRAKRYGWGWGLPLTWEGWLVFAAVFVLIGVATWLFPLGIRPGAWTASVAILMAVFTAVCLADRPPQ